MKKVTGFSRVLQGSLRGRKIPLPALNANGQNITTQKVKESVFNIIFNYFRDQTNTVFCDLFSGSGQIGIEAISRGFGCIIFCEWDQLRFRRLKLWLKKNSPGHSSLAFQQNGERMLKRVIFWQPHRLLRSETRTNEQNNRSFQNIVVFMDPPYHHPYHRLEKMIQSFHLAKTPAKMGGGPSTEHKAARKPAYENILYLLQTPKAVKPQHESLFQKSYQYGNNQILVTGFLKDTH